MQIPRRTVLKILFASTAIVSSSLFSSLAADQPKQEALLGFSASEIILFTSMPVSTDGYWDSSLNTNITTNPFNSVQIRNSRNPSQWRVITDQFLEKIHGTKIVANIYIHGFNNNFNEAVGFAKQLFSKSAKTADSLNGVFFWCPAETPFEPSLLKTEYSVSELLRKVKRLYYSDYERAVDHSIKLKNVIGAIISKHPNIKINLIAHSMGGRILINALNQICQSLNDEVPFGQIVLISPDIAQEDFANAFKQIEPHIGRVTVYTNKDDLALYLSTVFRNGDDDINRLRIGLDQFQFDKLPRSGIDYVSINTSTYGLKHNPFDELEVVRNDVEELIALRGGFSKAILDRNIADTQQFKIASIDQALYEISD
jgi:esterase/lipase superfamily enzyme